ncbi:MAG: rhodanese-like domain-containing protein, partial [Actinobacteria bacterium]|nr:rhodanese-like domain-containing protein [Actinomycetota bacterium]NIS36637.1 rhodanese-like domain-containing protein [Actinomycetota bacterium]NIU22456.1 rhodanese-like domain-containing protein [Actinomycetota bacterium]NIU71132.1 rhodanese-like domain-containing protein [Actinomycetota bacterium]NIV90612.1 MBL fold metallo-hydrolase [Actinomycetota bacterium]
PVNLVGVSAIDADPLEELAPADIDGLDAEIIDLRPARAWAAGHIPGSLSVPSRDDTAQYIGWVLPWNRPVVLVGEAEQVDEVRLKLARIGHDAVAGA